MIARAPVTQAAGVPGPIEDLRGEAASGTGYHLLSVAEKAFAKSITAPAPGACRALAGAFLDDIDDKSEEIVPDPASSARSRDPGKMAFAIARRLVAPDWYADLSLADAEDWDRILTSLPEVEDLTNMRFRSENDGSLDWAAAGLAPERGATMMARSAFGKVAFRYQGRPANHEPIYGLYLPDQARLLLAELEAVSGPFLELPDGEGSVRQQFFEGLLKPVRSVVALRRVLWVEVDT